MGVRSSAWSPGGVELPTSAEFLKTNFEDRALNEKIKAAQG
jgi:hypothetical protein